MGEQRKTFASFLTEQRKGSLHGELTEALAEVTKAAMETGNAGQVKIQIDIKPNPDGATVVVTDKVVLKVPEADRGAAIFFADEAGNLTRSNPNQPELPLRAAREEQA